MLRRLSLQRLLRYRVVGIIVLLWAAVVLLAPSLQPTVQSPAAASTGSLVPNAVPSSGAVTGSTDSASGAAGSDKQSTGTSVSGGGASGGPTTGTGDVKSTATSKHGAVGRSLGGVLCTPGALQVKYTTYAPPCQPVFHGNNGGATSNGVTATTIRIAFRYATSPLIDNTPPADSYKVTATWLKYFNKTYELYGRHVVLEYYKSPHGNPVEEEEGSGEDAACEDAVTLSQQHHDFGVLYSDSFPFMRCAAEQHLMIFDAEGRPTESFLQQLNPYVWGEEMDCYRVALSTAAYVGRRLVGRTAKYAGDPAYRDEPRKFGLMYPNNDTYQPCLAQLIKVMQDTYHTSVVTYAYTPDITRLGDQAAQAVLRFKAAGVTTIIPATDYITMQILTKAAASNDWYPEWVDIGTGGTDSNENTRGDDQSEIDGHLFGRTDSALEAAEYGPRSEENVDYRRLTGRNLPADTDGGYYSLRQLFRFLQAAGPDLTPENIERGAFSLPPETGALGTLDWDLGVNGGPGTAHEGQTNSIGIWWVASADGGQGAFEQTDGDRFYTAQQWPTTEPKPPRS